MHSCAQGDVGVDLAQLAQEAEQLTARIRVRSALAIVPGSRVKPMLALRVRSEVCARTSARLQTGFLDRRPSAGGPRSSSRWNEQ